MALWILPSILAMLISSVFLTHKIVGPVFVFQRAIRNMAAGKPVDKIHLRKRDFLSDFANDLNALIDAQGN